MYNIGQVVYIYKESNDSLFPCVVCEEVVKKTLDGTETNYKVLLPDAEGTIIDLTKMDVIVFKDIEMFKEHYMSKCNSKMNSSIDNCTKILNQKFKSFSNRSLASASKHSETLNESKKPEKVVIEDGSNAKLTIDMSKLKELGL